MRYNIIRDIMTRYTVGPRYARAYLDYWTRTRGREYHSLDEILSSVGPEPMWFDYAMSTNWRGNELLKLIAPRIPSNARRYLDVGCGFGGYLVAFSKLGLEVQGIEIDAQRVELARTNCLDHGLAECVWLASILDEGLAQDLGQFDVITCVDVIEHVLDVPLALKHMMSLLRPDGILVLEIPNRHYLGFVAHDGHFGLFGITLLSRTDAMAYHRNFFSFDYDVGDYYDLEFFECRLRKMGCECHLLSSPLHVSHRLREMDKLLKAVLQSYAKYLKNSKRNPFSTLDRRIQWQFVRYLMRLILDTARLLSSAWDIKQFKNRYLTGFWTLLARKVDKC